MKSLKNKLIGEAQTYKLSDEAKDMKNVLLAAGRTEMGAPGVIIGKPFTSNSKSGEQKARELAKQFGTIDYTFDDCLTDMGDDVTDFEFVYFMDLTGDINCYVLGNGGVYIEK